MFPTLHEKIDTFVSFYAVACRQRAKDFDYADEIWLIIFCNNILKKWLTPG